MRAAIVLDECKPHWAKQHGYDKEAERLGMTNIKILGDFDMKITEIWGDVADFEQFKTAFKFSALSEAGSLAEGA